MIIKGRCRGYATQLANYLRDDKNERVQVVESGATGDLKNSLRDMERLGQTLTQSEKPLYHACLRAAPGERLTPEQWVHSVDTLGKSLKLQEQDRVVVLHTLKDGITHAHVVWSRVDAANQRVISNSWDAVQWHRTARQLEKELGLQLLQSRVASEQKTTCRNQSQRSQERQMQADGGREVCVIKAEVTACWTQSATGTAFKALLAEKGYSLHQGQRSAYVLIDQATNKPYNPARLLDGVKVRDLRTKCADLEEMPTPTPVTRPLEPKAREAEWQTRGKSRLEPANDPAPSTRKIEFDLAI